MSCHGPDPYWMIAIPVLDVDERDSPETFQARITISQARCYLLTKLWVGGQTHVKHDDRGTAILLDGVHFHF